MKKVSIGKVKIEDAATVFKVIFLFTEKALEKKKKEKSIEFKVPCKRKSVTLTTPKKLPEEVATTKKTCNPIENQENRVNCANSKNYNSDSTSSITEIGPKETDHRQNGTKIQNNLDIAR